MKYKLLIGLIALSLLMTACSTSGKAATETPAATPTAAADGAIVAEGRVEPVRDAEIAFNASGVISEVLVKEGQAVKQGDPLIRLGDESDTQYAAAQLALVSAQKALNDLKSTAGTDLAQAVIDLKDAKEEYNDAEDYLYYLQHEDKVPRTETIRSLVQTWKGYQYRIKTKDLRGPAPEDWI